MAFLVRNCQVAPTVAIDDGDSPANRWAMLLHKLGSKQYYLGVFFKVRKQEDK